MATAINGGVIMAYDGQEHRIMRDGVVVIEGDMIKYVGKTYDGQTDRIIEAKDKLILPGFINTHCHISASPLGKLYRGDGSNRALYNSDILDYLGTLLEIKIPAQELRTIAKFSITEMLKSGNTTIVEMGLIDKVGAEAAFSLLGETGIRAYVAKSHNSGWWRHSGMRIKYENFDGEKWNEEPGLSQLEESIAFVRECNVSGYEKIRPYLYPGTDDLCSAKLLKKTKQAANDLGVFIQIHAAESVLAFNEIMRRYGKTPIGFLQDIGFLGPDVILGHCIFIGGHSKLPYTDPWEEDLRILAETGTSVAHCPGVFSRYGTALESYFKYLNRGINVALGTDIAPQDMIKEMRNAGLISKIVEKEGSVSTAGEVFNSATLMGAKALHRSDLGRIEAGAKADIVIVNLKTLNMVPCKDPIKNFVLYGGASDVNTVMVGGEMVVEGGKVKGVDEEGLVEEVQRIAEGVSKKFPEYQWEHKSLEELKPNAFPDL